MPEKPRGLGQRPSSHITKTKPGKFQFTLNQDNSGSMALLLNTVVQQFPPPNESVRATVENTMKLRFFIPFLCLISFTACRTHSTPEVEYSTLLQSDELQTGESLSDEALESALAAVESFKTLPETRWSLFVRLCTEDYSRFRDKLPPKGYGKAIPLGDGTKYIIGTPPSFKDVDPSHNDPDRLTLLLPIFHDPDEADQLKYFTYMLEIMEGPLPETRKLNGLYNIQRVMSKSQNYKSLNEPKMKEFRKRFYALAEDEETLNKFRNELDIWLAQMNQEPEESKDNKSSNSTGLRFFDFNPADYK